MHNGAMESGRANYADRSLILQLWCVYQQCEVEASMRNHIESKCKKGTCSGQPGAHSPLWKRRVCEPAGHSGGGGDEQNLGLLGERARKRLCSSVLYRREDAQRVRLCVEDEFV